MDVVEALKAGADRGITRDDWVWIVGSEGPWGVDRASPGRRVDGAYSHGCFGGVPERGHLCRHRFVFRGWCDLAPADTPGCVPGSIEIGCEDVFGLAVMLSDGRERRDG